jgi:hypothetical protein
MVQNPSTLPRIAVLVNPRSSTFRSTNQSLQRGAFNGVFLGGERTRKKPPQFAAELPPQAYEADGKKSLD